jgi:hypothetical protein
MKDDLSLAILLLELPVQVVMRVTGYSRSAVFRMRESAKTEVQRWSQVSPKTVPDRSQALDGIPLSLEIPPVPKGTSPQGDSPPRKPKAEKKQPRAKTICPADWEPSDKDRAFAADLGVNPDEARDKMRDWSLSGDNRKADWGGTYRNWVRREAKELEAQKERQARFGTPPGFRSHQDRQSQERAPAPYHRPFQD